MQQLLIRKQRAQGAFSAMRTLGVIAGFISVLFSGICLLLLAREQTAPYLGEGWLRDVICAVLAFGFCYVLDFLGIARIFGFAIGEVSRWFLAPSTVNLGQRIVAVIALVIGVGFIAASGFTSYYGSKMAGALVATKAEAPAEAKQVTAANKEYEAALKPARARLDSLEKAKAAAIATTLKPYAASLKRGSRSAAAVADSVARAKDKEFAAVINSAQTSLKDAEKLHGNILSQKSASLMSVASMKTEAMSAKNGAVWAVLLMFGLGAIAMLTCITATIAFMEVNATCPIERRAAKVEKAATDELDISSAYGSSSPQPSRQAPPKQQPRPQPSPVSERGSGVPFEWGENN